MSDGLLSDWCLYCKISGGSTGNFVSLCDIIHKHLGRRYPESITALKQSHFQLLDVVNGNVDYDVHKGEPGDSSPLDIQCPRLCSATLLSSGSLPL